MDYKKKYKQLHTLISDLYPFMSEYCKEKVEGFFPELAGSKDERIRKALLEMVHDTTGDELWIDYNVHKEEALAWLEKQGEKEIDKWKEGNIIKHGGILALVIKGRRAMKSNGEIFTVQYPDEWVKAVPNEIEHFLNELEKQGEKPQGKTALEAINEEKVDNANKIKPKFKVGDWAVNNGHSYLIADIEWLKSLRPQNTWKPSDEQIKVCKEVYADILSAKGFDLGTVNSELNRLEEQLKKLREE